MNADKQRRDLSVFIRVHLWLKMPFWKVPRRPSAVKRKRLDFGRTTLDSLIQLLLAEAASDFHSHRPPSVAHIRDVRIGHVTTADGAKQYMLCGEFLPARREGKAEWTPFATIKTSGYEQWLGAQAANLCQRSTVIWDSERDLSSSLQTRLDSMR
ncbi:MAG TPA: hypothetical protein VKF41_01190 [Bryobacteraceae bacterium]|nr:hypothetical protein [Bryobacteraceae bacterium]